MFLADLRLEDMPTSALIILRRAISDELLKRKKERFVQEKTLSFKRNAHTYLSHEAFFEDDIPQVCRALPEKIHSSLPFATRYLRPLCAQDWTFLFPTADTSKKEFYVYVHIDPRKQRLGLGIFHTVLPGLPFYVGKGSGNRAYDLKRNDGHRKIIGEIRAMGFPDTIIPHILKDKLTEQEALTLEAKLIYFFGSTYDDTRRHGYLINLMDHARPLFVGEMPLLDPPKKSKGLQESINNM
jgi:hypothetical protein